MISRGEFFILLRSIFGGDPRRHGRNVTPTGRRVLKFSSQAFEIARSYFPTVTL
jgi:hypothetical protein